MLDKHRVKKYFDFYPAKISQKLNQYFSFTKISRWVLVTVSYDTLEREHMGLSLRRLTTRRKNLWKGKLSDQITLGFIWPGNMTIPVNLCVGIMLPSALFHRNEKVAIKKISPFEHQTYCQVTFLQKDLDWWSLREDKFGPTLKCRRHVIWPIESISSIFTTLDIYGDIPLRL